MRVFGSDKEYSVNGNRAARGGGQFGAKMDFLSVILVRAGLAYSYLNLQ